MFTIFLGFMVLPLGFLMMEKRQPYTVPLIVMTVVLSLIGLMVRH